MTSFKKKHTVSYARSLGCKQPLEILKLMLHVTGEPVAFLSFYHHSFCLSLLLLMHPNISTVLYMESTSPPSYLKFYLFVVLFGDCVLSSDDIFDFLSSRTSCLWGAHRVHVIQGFICYARFCHELCGLLMTMTSFS